jgi:hypothetical protein
MITPSRVARAHDALCTTPRAVAPTAVRASRLRRLADWLSALVADEGMSARFDGERQRDEDIVRRVERQRRP